MELLKTFPALGPPKGGRALGVDMGGSSTKVHLLAADEGPVSWATAGGNLALDPDGARAVIEEIVARARPTCAILGLAGARTASAEAASLERELAARLGRVQVVSDAEIALLAAFGDGDGIVVSAGTGSVVVVRVEGKLHVLGGHGYLLDDVASAYGIGRRLLRAALRGRDVGDVGLAHELERALGEPLDDIVRRIYQEPTARTHVAMIARHVGDVTDPAGRAVREQAVVDSQALIASARDRFGPLPVALLGGVFRTPAIADPVVARTGARVVTLRPDVAAARRACEA